MEEGRKVTRAQTPTESIEDTTRHGTEVPDRASSPALPYSSTRQRVRSSIQRAIRETHIRWSECPASCVAKVLRFWRSSDWSVISTHHLRLVVSFWRTVFPRLLRSRFAPIKYHAAFTLDVPRLHVSRTRDISKTFAF